MYGPHIYGANMVDIYWRKYYWITKYMYMYIPDGYFAKIIRHYLYGITYRIKIMLKGIAIVKPWILR